MRLRAVEKARQHRLLLIWMRHRELIEKLVPLRPARARTEAPKAKISAALALGLLFSVSALAAPASSAPKTASLEKTPSVKVGTAKIADEREDNQKIVEKTVAGSVVFVRKNKLSVEFASNEEGAEEILLSIEKDAKLKNLKSLSQLKPGDEISVKYLETYLEPKDKDAAPTILKMAVAEIRFLRRPPVGMEVAMENKGSPS